MYRPIVDAASSPSMHTIMSSQQHGSSFERAKLSPAFLDEKRSKCTYPDRWSAPGSADRNKQPLWATFREFMLDMLAQTDDESNRKNSKANVKILEIASGHGQQITHIASELDNVLVSSDEDDRHLRSAEYAFTPSEVDEHIREILSKQVEGNSLKKVHLTSPLELNLDGPSWHTKLSEDGDANHVPHVVLAFNLVHIAPWNVAESLFTGTAALFSTSRDGEGDTVLTRVLVLYGAFNENGCFTSEGNQKVGCFDGFQLRVTKLSLAPKHDDQFDEVLKSRNEAYGLRDIQQELEPLAKSCGFELAKRREMPAGNVSALFMAGAPHVLLADELKLLCTRFVGRAVVARILVAEERMRCSNKIISLAIAPLHCPACRSILPSL